MPKIEKEITIASNNGLHARPATLFVQTAEKYTSSLSVRKDKEIVNGKSIMGLLMLGAQQGTKVLLIADGDDAQEMVDELERLISDEK